MIPLGVLGSARYMTAAPPISDDFNRADGPLGAAWTVISGAVSIASQAANNGPNTNSVARHNTVILADHFAQARATPSGGSGDPAVLVRFSASDMTCYMGRYSTGSGAWEIHRYVAGAATRIGFTVDSTPASPWLIRLEAQGSTLRLYGDGVLKVTVTDSTITGNTQVGLRLNAFNNTIDDFTAGPI